MKNYENCDHEVTMIDKIRQAIANEFKYRAASQGRTNYSMEEVIYIVNEVIDEVFWETSKVDTSSASSRCESDVMSQEQLHKFDMQLCVIRGDLKYLAEKVNKLSSLSNEEAINHLKYLKVDSHIAKAEALDLAIKALEERPKGKWIAREDMDYLDENKVTHNHFMCDKCGLVHDFIDGHTAQYNFCPNCGADMKSNERED